MTLDQVESPEHDEVELSSEDGAVQALIKEARQRQRRRHVAVLGMALLVVVVVGAILFLTVGSSGTLMPTTISGMSGGAPGPVISQAGLARMSFTYRNSEVGGCIPDTNSPVTKGTGSINFVTHEVAYTTSTSGCQDLNRYAYAVQAQAEGRWINRVFYLGQAQLRNEPGRKVGNKYESTVQVPTGELAWQKLTGISLASSVGFAPLQDLLTSPWALSVITTVQGSTHGLGTDVIDGQRTTESAGTTTLGAVYEQFANILGGPVHGPEAFADLPSDTQLVPPASSIPISVAYWKNAQNQVLRLQATEQLYTGVYVDGSDVEEATQVPSYELTGMVAFPGKTSHPVALALRTLRPQSTFEITVNFSSFGLAPAISKPSGLIQPVLVR